MEFTKQPSRPGPSGEASGEWLLVRPDVLVDRIDARSAVLYDPVANVSLQLSRPPFELFRRFYRPTPLAHVLPVGPARTPALECLRSLQRRGILIEWPAIDDEDSEGPQDSARASTGADSARPHGGVIF